MRLRLAAVAFGVLAATAVPGIGARPAEARPNFIVKRFLLGHLEEHTNRFVGTGGSGTSGARRDDLLQFVFTAPVDFDSLGGKSVQIRIPTRDGLSVIAPGAFYPCVEYRKDESDPLGGTYILKRVYRNRVLFDPTSRYAPVLGQNPDGFRANTAFTVTLPGLDQGALKAVEAKDGTALQRTFSATFATGDRYSRGW